MSSERRTLTGMSQEPRWLSEQEQLVWRRFAAVLHQLPAALDAQLVREGNLIQFSYWVLAMLSETPGHALRMSELATRSNSSQSRLSHLMGRLEGRGLVVRRPATDDGRGAFAELTPEGLQLVVQLAPGHVAEVRELVFDALRPEQVVQLGEILQALSAALEARRCGRAPLA